MRRTIVILLLLGAVVALTVVACICLRKITNRDLDKEISTASPEEPLSETIRYTNQSQKFYAFAGYRLPEGWEHSPVMIVGSSDAQIESKDNQCSFMFKWTSIEPPVGTSLEKAAELLKSTLERVYKTTVNGPELCEVRGKQPAYRFHHLVNAREVFPYHELPNEESDGYVFLTELEEVGTLKDGESMLGKASEDLILEGLHELREGYFPAEIFGFECFIVKGDPERCLSALNKIVDSFVRLHR